VITVVYDIYQQDEVTMFWRQVYLAAIDKIKQEAQLSQRMSAAAPVESAPMVWSPFCINHSLTSAVQAARMDRPLAVLSAYIAR